MSEKSLASILNDQILDDGLSVSERKKSLRRLPNPSRRFLQGLIRNPHMPADLRRAASRLLVAKLVPAGPHAAESKSPPGAQSPDEKNKTSAQAEIDAMSDELKELLGIIPDRKTQKATFRKLTNLASIVHNPTESGAWQNPFARCGNRVYPGLDGVRAATRQAVENMSRC